MASANDVVRGVLAKDYGVQLAAKQLGAAAVPSLAPLTRDADAEVRELAVYCLDQASGPGVGEALVGVVGDADEQVAAAAVKALHRHVTAPLYGALLAAYDRRPSAFVLRELALVMARLRGQIPGSDLAARAKVETVPEAQEGLLVARARLGDAEAREVFVARLHGARGAEQRRFLEYVAYQDDPWPAKHLAPLLDDETAVLRIGVDARPDLIDTLRVCDLALVLAVTLASLRPSFPVVRAKNYGHAERDEVKALLARLP